MGNHNQLLNNKQKIFLKKNWKAKTNTIKSVRHINNSKYIIEQKHEFQK